MIKVAVQSLCLLVVGCYAGGVLFVAIAPSVARQPVEVFVPYWQALNHDYAILPPFLLAGIALMLANVVAARRALVIFATAALSTLLFVASIAITVTQMVPLNELADRWSAVSPPPEAAAVRDSWWGLHLVRTWLAVASFCLLAIATTIPNRRPRAVNSGSSLAERVGTTAGGTFRVAQEH